MALINDLRWAIKALKKKPKIRDVFNFTRRQLCTTLGIKKTYKYRLFTTKNHVVEQINSLSLKPLISIIMPVYKVKLGFLKKAIKSVERQFYSNWQLCIVDDGSLQPEISQYLLSIQSKKILVKINHKNQGISKASNEAIALSTGEYLTFLDHDDELTEDALFEVVKQINKNNADFIYSDEDFITNYGRYSSPHFKPDFSPDLLLTHNYITHLMVVQRYLLDRVGYFDSDCNGAQDYDLALRLAFSAKKIVHIQKVLYHWRKVSNSVSRDKQQQRPVLDGGLVALKKHITNRGLGATVEQGKRLYFYRVKYKIKNNPLVSIIIPFKDQPELLKQCVNSVLEKTAYQNYELLLVSNNSELDETFTLMNQLASKDKRIRLLEYNQPFNYSAINNYAVEKSLGEHLLLLNNDTKVINDEWLSSMLEHSQRSEVGCVGAKLYYGDTKRIQHAGVILGIGGVAGHGHKHFPTNSDGYFGRLKAVQNYSAVTGACLMVKKSIYLSVGGLDEKNLAVAFNDVDFCLRVKQQGCLNVWTPYAELYHYESVSRGYEDTKKKQARFNSEVDYMKESWGEKLIVDNAYNPQLTLVKENFGIRADVY